MYKEEISQSDGKYWSDQMTLIGQIYEQPFYVT